MNPFKLLPVIACVAALACGNRAVDLDAPRIPQLVAGSDPDELGVIDEQVQGLAVDSRRLYWVGSWPYTTPNSIGGRWALRSCEKAACASSLVTYENNALDLTQFGVRGAQVYWTHRLDLNTTGWELVRCPVTGCDRPLTVAKRYTDEPFLSAFDSNTFYFYSYPALDYPAPPGGNPTAGLYRDSLSERDGTPQLVVATAGRLWALQVADSYLYWLEANNAPPYAMAIKRIRSDGSQTTETLASGLEINQAQQFGLAVSSDHVYWSQGSLRGAVARCPLTGCIDPGAPDVFYGPIRLPQTLLLDSSRLYWQNQTATSNYGVASCSLVSCSSPESFVSGIDAPGALAVDDDYLYTATADYTPDQPYFTYETSAHIRRIAKGAR
jgi:hypothetical protein